MTPTDSGPGDGGGILPDRAMPPPTDGGPRTDTGPMSDGGPGSDGGRRDGGGMMGGDPCMAPTMATGMMASVMVDTTGGGSMDLNGCGGMDPQPQAVVRYTVPGTGMMAVEFTTDVDATTVADTVVQVRTGMCGTAPADMTGSCFDDIGMGNFHSGGAVTAMGGDTLFFVLTGFGAEDVGTIGLDISASVNTPPTLTSASARLLMGMTNVRFELTVMGGDAEGNADGVVLTFLDMAGMPVDIDGSGMVDEGDTFTLGFEEDVAGMMTFTAHHYEDGLGEAGPMGEPSFYATMMMLGVTQVRVGLVDSYGATSPTMNTPLPTLPMVGFGAMCDAGHICSPGLDCTAGMCAAPAAVTTACMGATAITLAMNHGTAMGTLMPGLGAIQGSCSDTTGREAIYTVVVPAGMFDLIARTDVMGTMAPDPMTMTPSADTVVYARSNCLDPSSEPGTMGACADDVDGMSGDYRSRLEVNNVAMGSYSIFVESYRPVMDAMTLPFALDVTLRPVLAAGATCDPMGVMNRCATSACPATGMAVCPAM